MKPPWLGVLAFAVVVAGSSRSFAGCPNRCELEVEPLAIEPPLACLQVTAAPEECNCGLILSFYNRCSEPLEARDFEFYYCSAPSGDTGPCTVLEPSQTGAVRYLYDARGEHHASLELHSSAGEHRVDATSRVTEFHDGCSFGGIAPPSRSALWLLALAALAAFARRLTSSARRAAA